MNGGGHGAVVSTPPGGFAAGAAPARASVDDAGDVRAATRPQRLWLALRLPDLALEALCRGTRAGGPMAVAAGDTPRAPLVAIDAAARASGLVPGMGRGAAAALVPALRVLDQAPDAERAALEGLAAWAGRWTSLVSPLPPAGLLLEIGGSLRLHGGLAPLLERVREGVADLGYRARTGVAPTPLGAWLLGRAGDESAVTALPALAGRLARVPLACLDLPAADLKALRSAGLRRIGQCTRLPRDGLARRFGPELLEALDRAHGRRPDPRAPWIAPDVFERRQELPCEARDAPALLFAARRLLLELEGFLAARAGGVQVLEVLLAHRRGPATRMCVELVAPSREARHLLALLGERLGRLALAAPVVHLGIRAAAILPLAPQTPDLWTGAADPDEVWRALVERLGARLGARAVRGLALGADHRPERAGAPVAPGRERRAGAALLAACRTVPRPLWLLETPRPLAVLGGAPHLDGPLAIERGPERIETGWWDGAGVSRDYYVARNPAGEWWWICRERRGAGGWYAHGVFG